MSPRTDGRTATSRRRDEDSLAASVAAIAECFQSVSETLGPVIHHLRIDGQTVRISFAGHRLARTLLPALSHLGEPTAHSPGLSIRIWDTAGSGIGLPPGVVSAALTNAGSTVRRLQSESIRMMIQPEESMISLLDEERGEALLWLADAGNVPCHVRCAPLINLLQWWMCRHDRYMVHAGAVGTAAGGVLLAGKAGSGKSSAALACLDSGLRFAGDDYCLVSMNPEPYVHSLYSSAKLNSGDVDNYPGLAPALANPDRLATEKAIFFLGHAFPAALTGGFPIRAVVLPRVTPGATTRLQKTTGASALLALAPSTLFQLREAERETFRVLGSIIRRVPCFHLDMGSERTEIPRRIRALLEQLDHDR
ncbi:MAG: serine kinase [Acidobacteria bacterium]|nr:serine kinase [Acidobacteriota bacterium]